MASFRALWASSGRIDKRIWQWRTFESPFAIVSSVRTAVSSAALPLPSAFKHQNLGEKLRREARRVKFTNGCSSFLEKTRWHNGARWKHSASCSLRRNTPLPPTAAFNCECQEPRLKAAAARRACRDKTRGSFSPSAICNDRRCLIFSTSDAFFFFWRRDQRTNAQQTDEGDVL